MMARLILNGVLLSATLCPKEFSHGCKIIDLFV